MRPAVVAVALAGAAGAVAAMIVWKPWLQPAKPAASAMAVSKPVPVPPTDLTKGPLLQPGGFVEKAATETGPVAKAPLKKAPADPPHQAAEARVAPVEHADDVATDAATLPAGTPRPAVDALNRGRELVKQEQFAEAIQAFTKAADIRPNWAPGYVNRGGAYQHLEQYDAAIRDFSRAIRLNPKLFNAYLGRAQCYVHQKQDDPAFDDFNQALALKPDAHLALAGRAGIYLRRKAYHKALADYNEAIRLSPDLASAYRGRASARRALGDGPGAQADEEKYKEIFARKGDKGG
jgi:tetratricopeptide (TPR) repeat protein